MVSSEPEVSCPTSSFVQYGSLPPEIQHEILMYLPYKTILSYCITSKASRTLLKDEIFWQRKIEKDFGDEISIFSLPRDNIISKIVSGGGECYSEYRVYLSRATYHLEHFAKTGQFYLLEKYVNLGASINPWAYSYSPLLVFLKATSPYRFFDVPLLITPEEMRQRVKWFLDHGADPNISDECCRTPLMICEDVPIAKMLLAYGANPRAKDKHGVPVIKRTTDVSLMRVLLDGGSDPNDQDRSGFTALWDAVSDADENRVRLLLEYGARPDIKSKYGDTPLRLIEQVQKRLYNPQGHKSWLKICQLMGVEDPRVDESLL